jgi:hypothetical protein
MVKYKYRIDQKLVPPTGLNLYEEFNSITIKNQCVADNDVYINGTPLAKGDTFEVIGNSGEICLQSFVIGFEDPLTEGNKCTVTLKKYVV